MQERATATLPVCVPLRRIMRVRVDASTPTRLRDVCEHLDMSRYLQQQVSGGGDDVSMRLHHELGQLLRVSSQRVELQSVSEDIVSIAGVCGQPDSVSVSLQSLAQCSEWLDVSSGPHDQKHYPHPGSW